jgi:hypothetical protein
MMSFTGVLLNIAVAAAVLVVPFILTRLFVSKMYYKCAKCGNLNAKRRSHCRICAAELRGTG